MAFSQNYLECLLAFQIILTGFPKGDSPQCGEMSRRDKGDGRPLGGITLWQGCGDGDSLQCREMLSAAKQRVTAPVRSPCPKLTALPYKPKKGYYG